MVKRYGTSCAEREGGLFVKASDYEALEAEVRALREDAERWRWIRQGKSVWVKVPVKDKHVEYFIGNKPEAKFPECFDAAVDAARGSK